MCVLFNTFGENIIIKCESSRPIYSNVINFVQIKVRRRHEIRQRNACPVDAERRRVSRIHCGSLLFCDRVVVLVLRARRRLRTSARLQVSAVRHELCGRRFRGRRPVRVPVRHVLAGGVCRARSLRMRILRLQGTTLPEPQPPSPAPESQACQDGGRDRPGGRHQRLQQVYYQPHYTRNFFILAIIKVQLGRYHEFFFSKTERSLLFFSKPFCQN